MNVYRFRVFVFRWCFVVVVVVVHFTSCAFRSVRFLILAILCSAIHSLSIQRMLRVHDCMREMFLLLVLLLLLMPERKTKTHCIDGICVPRIRSICRLFRVPFPYMYSYFEFVFRLYFVFCFGLIAYSAFIFIYRT